MFPIQAVLAWHSQKAHLEAEGLWAISLVECPTKEAEVRGDGTKAGRESQYKDESQNWPLLA